MRQHFFRVPFALGGDVEAIPDAAQPDGTVSYTTGFGPDYSKKIGSDPTALPVPRKSWNAVMLDVTAAIADWQANAFPEWITPDNNATVAFPYALNAVVRYRAIDSDPFVAYVSTAANNTTVPGAVGATWDVLVIKLASQVQAETGTANDVLMSPLRVRQIGVANGWTTKPQFTTGTFLATVDFMWNNMNAIKSLATLGSGATSVAAADVGKYVSLITGAGTTTLPLVSGVRNGSSYDFNARVAARVISPGAGDNITLPDGSVVSTITLAAGESLRLSADGGTSWLVTGGSRSLSIASQAEALAGSDNVKFMTALRTRQAIQPFAVPTGATFIFRSIVTPAGYLEEGGQLVLRADYPDLWAWAQASGNFVSDAAWIAGNQGAYSSGNGTTTFRLPDSRGVFTRGWDHGRGLDIGRSISSYQADAFQDHQHVASAGSNGFWVDAGGLGVLNIGGSTLNINRGAQTGTATGRASAVETRPMNIAAMFCVKT